MKLLIDADGCPVVNITVSICKKHNITCLILCDTAHEMHRDGATTLTFDKGADSVDFALVNRIDAGDIVITQDYGLASMCLAKQAKVLHQDGWEYTEYNIQALCFSGMNQRFTGLPVAGSKGRQNGKPIKTRLFPQHWRN